MEDEALIARFLSGDEEGFAMLVRKYQGRIANIVYSLTGDTQKADDIAQEVFIQVYRNLADFRKKAEFATWLYRITVNTTYNYLKKERRYVPTAYLPETDGLEKRTFEKLASKERQDLVKQTIERLPFKLRTAIVLKEIEGLSYKDIAKTLGCRLGTVESRLFRAREMLKRILTPILKEEAERCSAVK